jgi:hypothetical protein
MALAAHSERLHKIFLLLLSATSPGEVFAARNAMVRIAEEEQADIHDLAKAFGVMTVVSLEAPSTAREIAQWCLQQFDNGVPPRSEREREFIDDMAVRWGKPTEKQESWLASIYARLQRATK